MSVYLWGTMKGKVRDTLLRDVTGIKFPTDVMLDSVGWALQSFAQHTALATATSFAANGKDYDLPDNLLSSDPLEVIGQVYIVKSDLTVTYLDSIRYTEGVSFLSGSGFYTYPEHSLHLTDDPPANSTVCVNYFAHYDEPFADDSPIQVPIWARLALSYLTAAIALSGSSYKTGSIRQWNTKEDSGNPSQNPLADLHDYFMEMYERELNLHPVQDRVNKWKEINERLP